MHCAAARGLSLVVSRTSSGTMESGMRKWPAARISSNRGRNTGFFQEVEMEQPATRDPGNLAPDRQLAHTRRTA